MKVQFHPAVQRDFNQAIAYYGAVSECLADRIEAEFRAMMEAIRANPRRFSFYLGSKTFRRAKLPGFPYVIIYREKPGFIRVTVFKSEKRHPRYGMGRY